MPGIPLTFDWFVILSLSQFVHLLIIFMMLSETITLCSIGHITLTTWRLTPSGCNSASLRQLHQPNQGVEWDGRLLSQLILLRHRSRLMALSMLLILASQSRRCVCRVCFLWDQWCCSSPSEWVVCMKTFPVLLFSFSILSFRLVSFLFSAFIASLHPMLIIKWPLSHTCMQITKRTYVHKHIHPSGVQPSSACWVIACDGHLQSQCTTTVRSRRSHPAWKVLQTLHREIIQDWTPGKHLPWNP